jgi:chemotaxis protein MotB
MVTLLLCFCAVMFNPDDITQEQIDQIRMSVTNMGLGFLNEGSAVSIGKTVERGNSFNNMPAASKGKGLGDALQKAVSLFNPEIRSSKVRITANERGLIISLVSDAFFKPASDEINIEETRDILLRLGFFLNSEDAKGKKFRIEGHTDSTATDPINGWRSNWDLSVARSISVLFYLMDLGVDERRFQVSGFADTMPISKNDTPEGRAYNRRVDIVILDDGHL